MDSQNTTNKNILINALPKSGSLYIARTLSTTLSCEMIPIGKPQGPFHFIDTEALYNFLSKPKSVCQEHIPATDFHLNALHISGLKKIVIQFRDPRDAIVSWAHHIERQDIAQSPWIQCFLISSGNIPENYYTLDWQNKLDHLIKHFYPQMIDWMKGWLRAAQDDRFSIMINTYEKFVDDKESFIQKLIEFFDLHKEDLEIQWPSDSSRMDKNINLDTHFRRGISGSHLDELSALQLEKVNSGMDPDLAKQFGWN